MSEIISASAAEWEVLRVIWGLDNATSRDVSLVLKESKNWENATTKTLLGRLVKKGYLSTRKEGNRFIYTAEVSEQDGVDQRVDNVFSAICDTAVGSAIANAIRDNKLSFEDKERILEALNQKDFQESVACTCSNHSHTQCQCEPGNCTCGMHQ